MEARGVDRAQLSALLSPSIGDAKAASTIADAMYVLDLPANRPMSVADALRVLERVAQTPGIVGVAARFAKSRVHLMR